MEKAIKNKVAKAVVPAIDVMFQALRSAHEIILVQTTLNLLEIFLLFFLNLTGSCCFIIFN